MDNHTNNNNNNLDPSDNNPNINPNQNTTNININNNNNNDDRDQLLRHLTHLNKLSHKISKPTRPAAVPSSLSEPPVGPQPQQPPVYNINKSDFRDVVQKLTGSPAHAPSSSIPAIHAPQHKPATSSRLQRIRPPPLAQLSTRPPSLLSCAGQPNHPPMSPLPPLPTCHGAAESPISAYMRFLNSQPAAAMMFPPPENLENVPPSTAVGESSSLSGLSSAPPSSPLQFGCLPSPKSPCPLLLPLSPTISGVPSPKWTD